MYTYKLLLPASDDYANYCLINPNTWQIVFFWLTDPNVNQLDYYVKDYAIYIVVIIIIVWYDYYYLETYLQH